MLEDMTSNREEEVVVNVACGLDPLTAIVAASDDPRPPRRQRPGCVAVLIVALTAWAIARAAGM